MPPATIYIKDVIRFPKDSIDSVIRCFFYTVLSLRLWEPMRFDQENVPGTSLWFTVPKDFKGAEEYEKVVKSFTQSMTKGKMRESGSIVVSKFTKSSMVLWHRRDDHERWALNFSIDSFVNGEDLERQLRDMMQQLTNFALAEGQGDSVEESAQFDITLDA